MEQAKQTAPPRRRGRPPKEKPRLASYHQPYTSEEDEYIREHWGDYGGIPSIAKALGRSVASIKNRAQDLKVGPYLNAGTMVTLNQLTVAINGLKDTGGNRYALERWLKAGMPTHKIRVETTLFRMVEIREFWEWAEKHQSDMDFSRFEENTLGEEPLWAKRKRRIDRYNRTVQHPKKVPWTEWEIAHMKTMIEHGATYEDLARELQRTSGAIRRKIYDLYLPRPVEAKMVRWSENEMRWLTRMTERGFNLDFCAKQLGRSPEAVRGKLGWIRKKGLWTEYAREQNG